MVTLGRDYTCESNCEGFSNFSSDTQDGAKCIKAGYDTHFIPEKYYGTSWTGKKLFNDVDFQAVAAPDPELHELVSYSFDQVLPLAVVYFFQTLLRALVGYKPA